MTAFERVQIFFLCLEDGFWYFRQAVRAWKWLMLDDSLWMYEQFWYYLNEGTCINLFD